MANNTVHIGFPVGYLTAQYPLPVRKTPPKEIEKAKRELADLLERGVDYEE